MHLLLSVAAAALCGAVIACGPLAHAQIADYPARPIRIVVPFPAGGATDLMTRNISQELSAALRQPVVVENRGGANGMIGAEAVAKSPGDGYTLLTATIAHSANASLFPAAPYRMQSDLQPVAIFGFMPLIAVVRADSAVRSLQDLEAAAKAKPMNAGSSGNGTAAHLALELFKGASKAPLQHVPYKGGAPAMTDLLGGQIDCIFALMPEALPHVKSGKLKALAVTSDQRHPLLPEVPTAAEAGFPSLTMSSWNGLMAPATMARELALKLNAQVARIVSRPEMRARIVEQGYQPVSMSIEEARAFVASDIARWAGLVREANIKAD